MRGAVRTAVQVFVCGISGTTQTDERAQKVLSETRAALGGEAGLSAVKSLSTTGSLGLNSQALKNMNMFFSLTYSSGTPARSAPARTTTAI